MSTRNAEHCNAYMLAKYSITRTHYVTQFNGENLAGAAFLLFSVLILSAGQVNPVFGKLYPVYFILVGAGMGLILLGYRTSRNDEKALLHREYYQQSRHVLGI